MLRSVEGEACCYNAGTSPARRPRRHAVATMIKLRLPADKRSFAAVQALPGLAGLKLDAKFSLIPLSPRDNLYAVRTADPVTDMDRRRALSPDR